MNAKITFMMLLFATLLPMLALAQTQTTEVKPKKKVEWGIDGMLGISYGSETLGINVGGPSLKFRAGKFKIGAGCFPSLIVVDKKAMPRLAVSPIAEYRNFMLITPYYGYDSKDRQIWTFGAGYKFF
jgi:hypothetical protein